MSLVGVIVVKFTDAIARVLERRKVRAGRGASFRAGVAALFVTSLPVVGSSTPTVLCQGGCDYWVVAVSSIP